MCYSITMKYLAELTTSINNLPKSPGVYLFKNSSGDVLYIGKAKQLRVRVKNYLQTKDSDWKSNAILSSAASVDHILTTSELEAMLLEARLVHSYQPPFNVLLKSGQSYTYFLITQSELPEFKLVRNKKEKGLYFGPFIEKTPARRVFSFLQKTFQLSLCHKTIENGCLAYHIGKCAGICRSDFDREGYLERINLVKRALTKGRAQILSEVDADIRQSNTMLHFERSAQLVEYKKAFNHVFESIDTRFDRPQSIQTLAEKDIWVHIPRPDAVTHYLFLFTEVNGLLKKKRVFCFLQSAVTPDQLTEYMVSFYREMRPAQQIITNIAITNRALLRDFITQWHQLVHPVSISIASNTVLAEQLLLARLTAEQELDKKEKSGSEIKRTLRLNRAPRTIDCFDISHKQGHYMVGSCIRFTQGQPDKQSFRRFHIKTLDGQNDYAALQEVVMRRYYDESQLPDLVVIDGGKGQLSAVKAVMGTVFTAHGTELVSLAKREETIFAEHLPEGKVLDPKSIAGQLLIALRDYTHHFAITFHRSTEQKQSL